MSEAKRDQNHVPTALGVSSVDGVTTLPLQVDPVTGRLLTDVAGGGAGTVTSVSVVSANGFAGTVATATSTPAITLTTSITGVLKGNGTAISAATDGTDYLSSTTGLTLDQTAAQTIANDSPIFGALTASELVATTAAKKLQSLAVATYPSLTEISYVKGVTSAIQTQINAKGTGNVTKVGTPVDNQIGVWTGDGTIEGDASLTYDGTNLNLATAKNFQIAGATVLADAAGTTTLSNIDAVDATTEATIEAAIDTLNNLTLTGTPQVLSTDAGASGPEVDVYHNSASPAANDVLGKVTFNGKDSATNKQEYASIKGIITSPTSTTEQGQITFGMVTGGTVADRITFYAASVVPVTNDAYALGSTTNQFSDLFLAEGGVINWDNGDVTMTQTGNVLAISGGDLQVATAGVGTNADSVPTLSSTNTFTNKRITKRTGTTTSSATPTINTDNVDFYSLTAQAADITSFTTNLSGTPTEGQTLWIAITGTAARAITWGSSFEASTVALPTTTVTTNRLDVGFVWNTVTSKWRCIASA